MKATVTNKFNGDKVVYDNAIGYDTHMAIDNGNGFEPVFQIIMNDGLATFHKNEWELSIMYTATIC